MSIQKRHPQSVYSVVDKGHSAHVTVGPDGMALDLAEAKTLLHSQSLRDYNQCDIVATAILLHATDNPLFALDNHRQFWSRFGAGLLKDKPLQFVEIFEWAAEEMNRVRAMH